MKALIIADRPPQLDAIDLLKNDSHDIDLIITLGDLELHQISFLRDISIPKLGVYGNHCSGMYFEELGIRNMHLDTCTLEGITFGGFDGCVRYKQSGKFQYTQEEATEMMQNFPKVDVLICHCPPRGINDNDDNAHIGFDATRRYIDAFYPKYMLHGHTYDNDNTFRSIYKDTNIIYVQGSKIISFN